MSVYKQIITALKRHKESECMEILLKTPKNIKPFWNALTVHLLQNVHIFFPNGIFILNTLRKTPNPDYHKIGSFVYQVSHCYSQPLSLYIQPPTKLSHGSKYSLAVTRALFYELKSILEKVVKYRSKYPLKSITPKLNSKLQSNLFNLLGIDSVSISSQESGLMFFEYSHSIVHQKIVRNIWLIFTKYSKMINSRCFEMMKVFAKMYQDGVLIEIGKQSLIVYNAMLHLSNVIDYNAQPVSFDYKQNIIKSPKKAPQPQPKIDFTPDMSKQNIRKQFWKGLPETIINDPVHRSIMAKKLDIPYETPIVRKVTKNDVDLKDELFKFQQPFKSHESNKIIDTSEDTYRVINKIDQNPLKKYNNVTFNVIKL